MEPVLVVAKGWIDWFKRRKGCKRLGRNFERIRVEIVQWRDLVACLKARVGMKR